MIKKIILSTDGSEHALRAVELAADLAARYGAAVVVLHALLRDATTHEIRALSDEIVLPEDLKRALEDLDEGFLEASTAAYGAGPIIMPVPKDVLEKVGTVITEQARGVLRSKGVENVTVEIADASPARLIVTAAEHENADMIVMGSRGLGTIDGFLMGSVSQKVGHLAPCTVVTVR